MVAIISFIAIGVSVFAISGVSGAEAKPTPAKSVSNVQAVPLPYDQVSFQHLGRELTRYHFGRSLRRPFCYPVIGPAGQSLTRMGNPEAPFRERHHCSVWISHKDINGVSFWEDDGKGQIVCRRVEQYTDGPRSASMLSINAWQIDEEKVLMYDRRRISVMPLGHNQWMMVIDLQLEAPPGESVEIGRTTYGIIGVRMAKTISVHYGGGRILNSEGHLNEQHVLFKPARWVDYSGPITNQATGGITLMDHPDNHGHPTPFIVRNIGWMGICLTCNRPLTIETGKPLRLRYGLWVHAGVPKKEEVESRWKAFTHLPKTVPMLDAGGSSTIPDLETGRLM